MYCPRFLLRHTSTSRAGQAGGGSLKREKNYKPKKDFAYRIVCDNLDSLNLFLMTRTKFQMTLSLYLTVAGRSPQRHATLPTHQKKDSKLLQKYYSVLQSTSTKKYYPSTVPYCSVLPSAAAVLFCTTQYCSVLQNTTPVLLCTTKYYSVLLQYYNVLLQYYSVLQNTTPVLLQYYSVLQGTIRTLLCTTKYYEILLCTTQYYSSTTLHYKVLLCTTPVLLCTTQYYNVLLQYYSVLQSTTTAVVLQYYSVIQGTSPVLLRTTKYYEVLFRTTN